jgi:Heparinase II/III-like protein/Heparinase II/III N-terminus
MQLMVTARTVAHLRPRQVADRLTRGLRPLPPAPAPLGWALRGGVGAQALAGGEAGTFDGRSFTLLNQRVAFEGADRWRPSAASDLWAYTLHYFRYLWGMPAEQGLALIMDWIGANPPGSSPGWDPYPISLRLREWIEWLAAHPAIAGGARARILGSLAHQAAVLSSRPEHHLMGNHLLENAVSLCWAGASLEGPGSEEWLARGAALLASQLAEQVLADGVHEERSPMYQALLAEALLRLQAVASRHTSALAADVSRTAGDSGRRLFASLAALVHPDGEYALLNDCAFGVAPRLAELKERFPAVTEGDTSAAAPLRESGYLVVREVGGIYLVFDTGPIGPDHQPGHGHADTLGFELSAGGQRLVTDTGVTTYAPGSARAYDRGTAAHSTVQVDGLDHAELWGAFRCGARPRIEMSERRREDAGELLAGAYLARLAGGARLRHERRLRVRPGSVEIVDGVSCRGRHEAVVRLHLAPGVEPRVSTLGAELRRGEKVAANVRADGFEWRIEETPYHPEFGIEKARKTLVASATFQDAVSFRMNLDLAP